MHTHRREQERRAHVNGRSRTASHHIDLLPYRQSDNIRRKMTVMPMKRHTLTYLWDKMSRPSLAGRHWSAVECVCVFVYCMHITHIFYTKNVSRKLDKIHKLEEEHKKVK